MSIMVSRGVARYFKFLLLEDESLVSAQESSLMPCEKYFEHDPDLLLLLDKVHDVQVFFYHLRTLLDHLSFFPVAASELVCYGEKPRS